MKKNDCIITIRGRVDLQLAYEGDGRDWEYAIISLYLLSVKNLTSTLYSAEMYTTWSAAIKFVSDDAQGLKVHVLPAKITPEFNNSICEGSLGHSTHEEMFKHLREYFPHSIDFSSIHHELKASFEGGWSGLYVDACDMVVSKPVFNRRGDLLLELAVKHAVLVKKPDQHSPIISTVKDIVKGATDGRVNGAANGHCE